MTNSYHCFTFPDSMAVRQAAYDFSKYSEFGHWHKNASLSYYGAMEQCLCDYLTGINIIVGKNIGWVWITKYQLTNITFINFFRSIVPVIGVTYNESHCITCTEMQKT